MHKLLNFGNRLWTSLGKIIVAGILFLLVASVFIDYDDEQIDFFHEGVLYVLQPCDDGTFQAFPEDFEEDIAADTLR